SEKYDTPVMLRTTTRISHSRTVVELGEQKKTDPKGYQKNPSKYVMLPGFARQRHPLVEKRLLALADEAENSPFNRLETGTDNKIGIICSGIVYQYCKEAFPHIPVLKLGFTYPLPLKLIDNFCRSVEKVFVIEELDPFLAERIKAHGIRITGQSLFSPVGELRAEIIREKISRFNNKVDSIESTDPNNSTNPMEEKIPQRPPLLCPGCSHRGVFYALKQLKLRVAGDIGCYTLAALPPLKALDSCICMGASIGVALGMEKANPKASSQTVAVIGDSTFFHSGITPLIDAVYNDSSITVIILDNSTTGMTGHQEHPGTGETLQGQTTKPVKIADLCQSLGVKRVVETDTSDLSTLREIIKTEVGCKELSVIIYRRPCILKSRTFAEPLRIDPENCNGCKACLQPGCPSISFKDGKALIDSRTCTGCDLCRQLCKKNAIII
ncbi:MAG: thiamine pyrophosphate-dependent enzyme, partial [Dethiobacteria bacterium]